MVYQDIGKSCSCETAELSAACRLQTGPPASMRPSLLHFTNFIFYFAGGTNGCRAGGRRQAGEHHAERLRRPPRRLSGAAPRHW
eukprot:2797433-Prymnesium_polylepis.1